mmetsp:Transcript_17084/g.19045  ORF Transcript_17084/g.19045 Transcript_17084/m.19045 type:complete len:457 (+) Transcript_17084:38-1408(+)
MKLFAVFCLILVSTAFAQQVGTQQAENHPQITIQQCKTKGNCQTQSRSIVLDSNWRWTHKTGGYTNCYTGNEWDTSICPDPQTCAENCAIDGADYEGVYGVTASGNSVSLKLVTVGQYDTNIGSRLYLLEDEEHYQIFKLKNAEFTFDVDVSNLPCGLNGALYFVEMDADGGTSKYPSNKAGAKYGTGYCDAQCPHDLKWINGEANVLDWKPSSNNKNTGTGKYGTCCTEMDIWESNSMSTAYTPHVCTVQGQYRCSSPTECGDLGPDRYLGVCDKDGCDYNSYRVGNKTFFGKGMNVDSSQKITVVTQFITSDGTDSGDLVDIKRFYVQNGVTIPNSYVTYSNVSKTNSVTDKFCQEIKSFFGDNPDFNKKGGLKTMGQALDRGMVLVMSLWDDYYAYMLWLDSNYPVDKPATQPGIARGSCPTSSGRPHDVESQYPNANVVYSNIKYGPIGSTF